MPTKQLRDHILKVREYHRLMESMLRRTDCMKSLSRAIAVCRETDKRKLSEKMFENEAKAFRKERERAAKLQEDLTEFESPILSKILNSI